MYLLRTIEFYTFVTLIISVVCIISDWTFAAEESTQVYTFPLKRALETSFAARFKPKPKPGKNKPIIPDPDYEATDKVKKIPKVFVEDQRRNICGRPGLGYYIEVYIGTPDQSLKVLVDTGSSNFAVAAAPHEFLSNYYHIDQSSTYINLAKHVEVPYTQGKWSGDLGKDKVEVVSVPALHFEANVAGITESEDFFLNNSHWQGILGLGYKEIARPDSTVEPFFDSMVRQSNIRNIFAMQMCGTFGATNVTKESSNATEAPIQEVYGSMTIGGLDPMLYTGEIQYAPLRKEWFYEVIMTDLKVDNESLLLDCKEYNFDKTIVDSGTTNLRLPERVFNQTKKAIRRHLRPNIPVIPEDFWKGDVLMCPTDTMAGPYDLVDWFPSLTLDLQSTEEGYAFSLIISPKQYLRQDFDDEGKKRCYKFGISPSSDTAGAVIGAIVMEGFYVIFDRENGTVGFATSTCRGACEPNKTCSAMGPFVTDVFKLHFDAEDCGYVRPTDYDPALTITAYVLAGVCILCLLPVVVMLIIFQHRKRSRRRRRRADHQRLEVEAETETENS